jgi:hypothetical protein
MVSIQPRNLFMNFSIKAANSMEILALLPLIAVYVLVEHF